MMMPFLSLSSLTLEFLPKISEARARENLNLNTLMAHHTSDWESDGQLTPGLFIRGQTGPIIGLEWDEVANQRAGYVPVEE